MIIIEVFGNPIPQKQTRFARGRAYDPSASDIKKIQWQVKPHAPASPIKGLIEMDVTFYLSIPKATSKVKRTQMNNGRIRPDVKPDGSNMYYLIENALKGIIYDDDARVVDHHVHKYYSDTPKTVIKIRKIDESFGFKGEK